MALAAGSGLLVVILNVGTFRWRLAYVGMDCAVLVLSKAIGTFFATLVAVAYLALLVCAAVGGLLGQPP